MDVNTARFNVPGFKLGHWTHPDGVTGCTVLLADRLVPAVVDSRGGAPGTRETDLLHSGKAVQRVDAVMLTGGSAFGLAAADGVMRWLHEHGRGFPTAAINVPIVSGAVIFDLNNGDDPQWPGAHEGFHAVSNANDQWTGGRIGAGAGASVSKILGRSSATAAGIGIAQVASAAGTVSAVMVNNAFGDVYDDLSARYLSRPGGGVMSTEHVLLDGPVRNDTGQNTVIGAIVVDRPLDHNALTRVAVAGQAGVARVVRPAHSPVDGDTMFALATENGACSDADLLQLTTAAQFTVARALVSSIGNQSES